jgi:integrase
MKIYKRKGSPFWHLRHGSQRESLQTTRKAYALQLLEEYQAKRLGIYHVARKRVSSYFEPYLDYCRKYNKATTIDDKKRTLNLFKEQAGDPWLKQLNKKIVQEYLDSRVGKRSGKAISAERFNSERQILSNFFSYLIGEKVLKDNPAMAKTKTNQHGIERKKTVKNKAKFCLSAVEEAALDKYLLSGDDTDEATKRKRLSAAMKSELARVKAVAVNTGLRARELANLTWHDVDFDKAVIYVRAKPDWTPKDYEERPIAMNSTAAKALREQKLERSVLGKYVFCRQDGRKYGRGLDVAMCRAFARAGFSSGGLHTLRHTFATRYLQKGNLEDLRELLGHSDIRTTQRYLHGDSAEQRKTINLLG